MNDVVEINLDVGLKPPKLLRADELLSMKIDPPVFIAEPILAERNLALIVGSRGLGKTFFCLSLAMHVAAGQKFLAWPVTKARRVLYIDGEMPLDQMKSRMDRLKMMFAGEALDRMFDNLSLLSAMHQEFGLPDLSDPVSQLWYADSLDGFDLIFVDNLSSVCRSGSENEAECPGVTSSRGALSSAVQAAPLSLCTMAGKTGTQRGTSAREDIIDTSIMLSRPGGYDPASPCHFKLEFTKARGFYGDAAKPLEIALRDDENGLPVWTYGEAVDPVERERQECIETVLELRGSGMTYRAIAEQVGMSKSYVEKVCKGITT